MAVKTETAVKVLKEFLTKKLGREVSTEETYACMRALEKAYEKGELTLNK